MKSQSTIVQMMAAITDPVIIERCYQIFAAKRALLACNAEKTATFAHSYMEPRPVRKSYAQFRKEQEEARVNKLGQHTYKLAPSLMDVMQYKGRNGEFVLLLCNATAAMRNTGFTNGTLFKMASVGYERSQVEQLSTRRLAIVKNAHLRSVFRFDCGCINDCCCSARN